MKVIANFFSLDLTILIIFFYSYYFKFIKIINEILLLDSVIIRLILL